MSDMTATDFPAGDHGPTPARRRACKRVFDIVISIPLLVLLAPVMMMIAALIVRKDGGPIFYGHQRVGRAGASFWCWKFRTMRQGADAELERVLAENPAAREEWRLTHKLENDPRVIPGLGGFLRKTSLDELPQLVNVLMGEMSLVGPRPVTADELKQYGVVQPTYLSVRPGLTGPWQVGDRSKGSFDSRVGSDAHYVENWTFGLDVTILLQTLSVPFRRDGGAC